MRPEAELTSADTRFVVARYVKVGSGDVKSVVAENLVGGSGDIEEAIVFDKVIVGSGDIATLYCLLKTEIKYGSGEVGEIVTLSPADLVKLALKRSKLTTNNS